MNKGHFWIGMVLAFLLIDLTCGAVLVYFAHSSPSLGIEKDYQDESASWVIKARQRSANDRLGWTTELSVARPAGTKSVSQIDMIVLDRDGEPIKGAIAEIEAYHLARSDDRHSLTLQSDAEGLLHGEMRILREGFWQFDVVVNADGERFTCDDRQYVEVPAQR